MLHDQSNISKKNIKMAATWAEDDDPEIATLAKLVVDIGRVHPSKRKRGRHIHRNDPALFQRMIASGLVSEWRDDADSDEPAGDHGTIPETSDPYWSSLPDDDLPF